MLASVWNEKLGSPARETRRPPNRRRSRVAHGRLEQPLSGGTQSPILDSAMSWGDSVMGERVSSYFRLAPMRGLSLRKVRIRPFESKAARSAPACWPGGMTWLFALICLLLAFDARAARSTYRTDPD